MHLKDDFDEQNSGLSPTLITAIVSVTIFIALLFIIILVANGNKKSDDSSINNRYYEEINNSDNSKYPNTNDLITGSSLKPEDLDFWDKYPSKNKDDSANNTNVNTEATAGNVDESGESEELDPSKDGKHTLVKNIDGEEEWVLISPYLPKNSYDYTNLALQGSLMKYYENSTLMSFVGADISKYQDYVDFNKLKKAGVSFVMLRVGARGYGTGQLLMDDYFIDNIKRASDAELAIGLYFSSSAISEEEAVEEANLVLDSIGEYKITYPIAFDMSFVTNDSSRIDSLKKSEKTAIAKKFMETIEQAGFKSMLYGDKEWLIKEIDMSKLTAYDIWLSQPGDIPDFPYKFSMWQYNKQATIDGISGYASLNISFIDYTEK